MNTIIASGGRVASGALGLIITAMLTRALGVTDFGTYSLVLSFGAMLQVLADAGLYLTLTKLIAQHPQEEQHYVSHTISLRILLFIMVFVIGIVVSLFIPSLATTTRLLCIAAVGLLFQSMSQLYMGVYQKYQVVWRATVGDLVGRFIQMAVIGGAVWYRSIEVFWAAVAFSISCIAAFGVHSWLLPITPTRIFSFHWGVWKNLLKQSWPLALLLVVNMIYFRIDTLLLSVFRSPYEVGLYSLAYRVMESVLFFPAMFGGLLLPRLTESLKSDRARASGWLVEALSLMAVASGFILLIGWHKSAEIMAIFGTEFIPAAPLFRILTLALSCILFGTIFGFALVAANEQRRMLFLYTGLVIFNIAANWVLIPRYGAVAAAWVTVLTEMVATSVAGYWVYRVIPYRIDGFFFVRLGCAVAVTLAILSLMPVQWPILLTLLMVAAVYGGVSLVLKTIHPTRMTLLLQR